MKRFFGVIALACAVAMSSCNSKFDDGDLWNNINGLEERVSKLEEQCKAMNTNIASLHTIVGALQNQKTVTKVEQTADGCTIHFSDGTSATIRNGKDSDSAPVVSIRHDADGNYYWTLNGDYILVDGQKVKAQGTDGKDGQDGTDGKDGQNGTNGKDGVTPQLKIDSGYWYITYDNGATWTRLGKATGENGKDGADGKDGLNGQDGKDGTNGKDGRDGDGIKVTQDDSNVYFELNDGTKITIPKSNDITSIVDKVKSITFVPQYTDGKVEVLRENEEADGSAELDFLISPKEVVTELAAVWEQAVTVKAVYTKARSTKAVKFVDMPVTAFTADAKTGVVTVKVSGENLGDDFYAGKKEANAMLFISDGNTSRTSDYVAIRGDRESIYIQFQDKNVKDVCVAMWDTDGDGELSNEEAAAVTSIGTAFKENTDIKYFNELQYFTGLTAIEEGAFAGCTNLIALTIPANVVNFTGKAFYYEDSRTKLKCPQLKSIRFAKGSKLTTLSDFSLIYCQSLTNFEIPASIESIASSAFTHSPLANVTFEDGSKLKTINSSAFYKCSNLTSINLPNSSNTISISAGAFSGCSNLTDVTISASVGTIGDSAFAECPNLKNVTFEKGSKLKIIAGGGTNTYDSDKSTGCFYNCTSLKSINIPASVQIIEHAAFYGCSSLETVTFEEYSKLLTIGGQDKQGYYIAAFAECPNLTLFDASNCKQVRTIHGFAFQGSKNLTFKIGTEIPPQYRYDSFYTYGGTNIKILVPSTAVEDYISSWSSLSKYISGYDIQ